MFFSSVTVLSSLLSSSYFCQVLCFSATCLSHVEEAAWSLASSTWVLVTIPEEIASAPETVADDDEFDDELDDEEDEDEELLLELDCCFLIISVAFLISSAVILMSPWLFLCLMISSTFSVTISMF